jgi:hypothetical protein
MVVSLVLIGLATATFILSADLVAQTNYTICRVDETFTQLFDGTAPGVTPSWSGADNFYTYAQQISTNFPNTLPDLTTDFTSAEYQNAVDSNPGSLYAQAVSPYNCPSGLSSTTVQCPFASSFECQGGSPAQTPIFSQ